MTHLFVLDVDFVVYIFWVISEYALVLTLLVLSKHSTEHVPCFFLHSLWCFHLLVLSFFRSVLVFILRLIGDGDGTNTNESSQNWACLAWTQFWHPVGMLHATRPSQLESNAKQLFSFRWLSMFLSIHYIPRYIPFCPKYSAGRPMYSDLSFCTGCGYNAWVSFAVNVLKVLRLHIRW